MDYIAKNKMLFWCVIVLVLVNVAALTSFWLKKPPQGPPREQGRTGGLEIMEQRLGLSQEQARQFERIRSEHFARTRPLADDMHKLRMDLLDELFAAETDEANLQALLAELGDKQVQFETCLYRHFRELKEACNDPQVAELKVMLRDLIEATRQREPRRRLPGPNGEMPPGRRLPLPPSR